MASDKQTIVLATRNEGKIRELGQLLDRFGITVQGLKDWPNIGEIPETGNTFAENALLKARTTARFTGLIAIADDSGLQVDALNGRPGIFSARYADDWPILPDETRDQRNIRKLLREMENIPQGQRGARFVTAIAAVAPDGRELVATGQWDGEIAFRPAGHNGFGYDPVFYDPRLKKNAALLTLAEKSAVSHRGKALQALLDRWREFTASSRS